MIDTGAGEKVGPTLIIKPIAECSAGELIRLTSGAWAIVAHDSKARRIFVISGDDAPVTFVLPEDSRESCLSYGTGFRVVSVHASFVGIHTYGREGFDPIGKLIVSRPFVSGERTRRYFAAPADQPSFRNRVDTARRFRIGKCRSVGPAPMRWSRSFSPRFAGRARVRSLPRSDQVRGRLSLENASSLGRQPWPSPRPYSS